VSTKVNRLTVDLSQYPKLVVIYLGMRVNRLTGLKMLIGFGPQIANSAADRPDGLLSHENVIYFAISHARCCSPVRARHGVASEMDPIRAASGVVEELSSRFRRHGILAWDVSDAGRHGSDLRRCSERRWIHAICTDAGRAGHHVWRGSPHVPSGWWRYSSQREGAVRTLAPSAAGGAGSLS
jgi:hypothetical protein